MQNLRARLSKQYGHKLDRVEALESKRPMTAPRMLNEIRRCRCSETRNKNCKRSNPPTPSMSVSKILETDHAHSKDYSTGE